MRWWHYLLIFVALSALGHCVGGGGGNFYRYCLSQNFQPQGCEGFRR
jgi:hypothetical protein